MGSTTSTSTTATSGPTTVTPYATTMSPGSVVDFNGRNFGHEETVSVRLNGVEIATAHADGGGNFSTGSLRVPSTTGTYTYTFVGASSGKSLTSTIQVQ